MHTHVSSPHAAGAAVAGFAKLLTGVDPAVAALLAGVGVGLPAVAAWNAAYGGYAGVLQPEEAFEALQVGGCPAFQPSHGPAVQQKSRSQWVAAKACLCIAPWGSTRRAWARAAHAWREEGVGWSMERPRRGVRHALGRASWQPVAPPIGPHPTAACLPLLPLWLCLGPRCGAAWAPYPRRGNLPASLPDDRLGPHFLVALPTPTWGPACLQTQDALLLDIRSEAQRVATGVAELRRGALGKGAAVPPVRVSAPPHSGCCQVHACTCIRRGRACRGVARGVLRTKTGAPPAQPAQPDRSVPSGIQMLC